VRLALLLLSVPAAAARPQPSPLSLRMEAGYLQPTDSGAARGAGIGAGVAYRFTDQLAVIGSASQNVLWVRRAAGSDRVARSVTALAAGLSAVLDITPVSPFVELSVVQLVPRGIASYSLAARAGLGADFRLTPAVAVGLVVRTLTPLEGSNVLTAVGGAEVAARFVWTL
jgi:hypothetical protein